MGEEKDISLKEVFKTLTLFFVLSLISVMLYYSNFEREVDEYWQGKAEVYREVIENSGIYDIINLDEVKTEGDVCEFDKNELVNEYIEKDGELCLFEKLFEAYSTN